MDKFAVFDIDGTLIRWQLFHVIVNRLAKVGLLGESAHKKLREAMMAWKRRESPDAYRRYEKQIVQFYEKAIQQISTDDFDKLVRSIIKEYQSQTYIYTRNLVHSLQNEGYKLFIISGSHLELIEQIGKFYGFDDWVATHYERNDKSFTGNIKLSTLKKDESLRLLMERNNVTLAGSIGIGDTKSDIPMLEMVDSPIAFNPDQFLFEYAKSKRWKIVIERKSVIFELEPRDDGKYQLLA